MDGMEPGQAALFWSLSLAVAVLMGFWAARVGRRNGRSYAACFLLGFLLGIIGVLVVYLVGRRAAPGVSIEKAGGGRQAVDGRKHRVCGRCGNLIPADAETCGYCEAGTDSE